MTAVSQVLGFDRDIGANGELSYSIKSGRGMGKFRIHNRTGVVYAQRTFQPDQEYDLRVSFLFLFKIFNISSYLNEIFSNYGLNFIIRRPIRFWITHFISSKIPTCNIKLVFIYHFIRRKNMYLENFLIILWSRNFVLQ